MSAPPPPWDPNGPYAQGPYAPGSYPPGRNPYTADPYAPTSQPQGPRPNPRLPGRLGARVRRRPEARLGSSLAAAGVLVIVVGILVWAGGYFGTGLHIDFNDNGASTHGEGRRFLGAGLFLLLAVIGYLLLIVRRHGPLASAGAVAGAVGVPLAIGFATLDIGRLFLGHFPVNLDALAIISILFWLGSYFVVPGARGRSFYLGLTAIVLAGYVGFKASGDSTLQTAVNSVNGGGPPSGTPSTTTLGAIGLVFGLSYYAIAALLDRRGHHGAAVALAFAGFDITVGGVTGLARSFGVTGTGVLLILLGLLLSAYGGYFGRRFTTWLWSAAVLVGIVLVVAKASPNNFTAAGLSLIVIGAVVVCVAYLLSAATNEGLDIVDEAAIRPPALDG